VTISQHVDATIMTHSMFPSLHSALAPTSLLLSLLHIYMGLAMNDLLQDDDLRCHISLDVLTDSTSRMKPRSYS
jgi:hypothetical protein